MLTETSRPGKLSFFARKVVERHFNGYKALGYSGYYVTRKMVEQMRSDREFSLVHCTWERMFCLQDYSSC